MLGRKIKSKAISLLTTSMIKSIWRLGILFSAEEMFFNGGTILVSSYMVLLGTTSVAAHAIANSVFTTLYAPITAVGILATTVVGQCIGVSMVTMWGIRVGLGYLASIPLGYGIQGSWVCMAFEWLMRSVLFLLRYHGKKWLTKKNVIEAEAGSLKR